MVTVLAWVFLCVVFARRNDAVLPDRWTHQTTPHLHAVSVTHRVPSLPHQDDQNVRHNNTASVTFLA
jgi:hypothetical protein